MAVNSINLSAGSELDLVFDELYPITPDELLDLISRQGPIDDPSSNQRNAPSSFSPHVDVGEGNPQRPQSDSCNDHLASKRVPLPSDPPFLCPWPGCDYGKQFSNKATLTRHYKTLHVNRGSFACGKCTMVFNRKDNLIQHERSDAHKKGSEES